MRASRCSRPAYAEGVLTWEDARQEHDHPAIVYFMSDLRMMNVLVCRIVWSVVSEEYCGVSTVVV